MKQGKATAVFAIFVGAFGFALGSGSVSESNSAFGQSSPKGGLVIPRLPSQHFAVPKLLKESAPYDGPRVGHCDGGYSASPDHNKLQRYGDRWHCSGRFTLLEDFLEANFDLVVRELRTRAVAVDRDFETQGRVIDQLRQDLAKVQSRLSELEKGPR